MSINDYERKYFVGTDGESVSVAQAKRRHFYEQAINKEATYNEQIYSVVKASEGTDGALNDLLYKYYKKNFDAVGILRQFGEDAHVYMPGVGWVNGLQAGNYLESTGQTPATVDSPVGLVLDGMGSLGSELITNPGGPFTATTGWSGFNSPASVSVASDSLAITTNAIDQGVQFIATTISGATYKVVALVDKGTSTAPAIGFGATGGIANDPSVTTAGLRTITQTFVATGASQTIRIRTHNSGTYSGTFYVASCSLKQITGIQATQATTANKPILRRGAVNLLTYSGDFSNAAWTKTNTTPAGELLSRATSAAANTFQSYALAVGSTLTISAKVKIATAGGRFALRLQGAYPDRADAVFDLENGSVIGSSATTYTGASATISASGDYYVVALTATVAGTALARAVMGPTDSSLPITGWEGASVVLSNAYVKSAALLKGTYTAAQIQALGGIPLTTTAPASTEQGNYFWEFDGSNDSLSLGSVPFNTQDDICIVAGSAPASDITAGSKIFGIRSANGNSIIHMSIEAAQSVSYQFRDESLVSNSSQSTANTFAPGGQVVTSVRKVSNNSLLRVNGSVVASSATVVGASTFGANLPNIGSENATKYFKGNVYPIIAIKGTVSDAQLLTLEKWVASASGVTI